MHKKYIVILAVLLCQCSIEKSNQIPDYILETENLTIFSTIENPSHQISFEQQMSFGGTDQVPIGTLGGFSVDDLGYVYITDFDRQTLIVFEPNGNFMTRIGGKGNGPGEFLIGPFPYIVSNHLYAFDIMSLRLSIFSTDSFELIQTLNLNPVNKSHFDELADTHIRQIYPKGNDEFLVSFAKFNRKLPTVAGEKIDHFYLRYYLMDYYGRIISDILFKLKQQAHLTGKVDDRIEMAIFDFLKKPLIAVSYDGNIYSAMSDKFFIKKYTPKGKYLKAFYYSFGEVRLTRTDVLDVLIKNVPKEIVGEDYEDIIEYRKEIVRQNELPLNWPVLENMLCDDENRLWISTIVEDLDIYEWWVLEETGELITKFEWPRNEPIEVVKNGYMYTRQTDEETGLQQIVRYRIEFEES